jgi:N-methylhydantoinase A/oxoprolinase/acetone carboxylase beta subunit
LKLGLGELAEGIVRVANANMERALRYVSVQRGYDPREFTLVAFGGAGGMHACELADRLDLKTILVPRYAGVLSALGMLLADVTKDYSTSVLRAGSDISPNELRQRFAPLLRQARHDLRAEGFHSDRQSIEQLLDIRYIGQSYELGVPFLKDFRRRFDRRHARQYGYADPTRPIEIVNLRVKASGITEKPASPFSRAVRYRPKPSSRRQARFNRGMQLCDYYLWEELKPGAQNTGPSVVTGGEATVVIPPRFNFSMDGFGNLIIRKRK